jgi:hypothetical protein
MKRRESFEMRQELKMIDRREGVKREHLLERFKNKTIICPKCGLKGIQRLWQINGKESMYVSHPYNLLWLDDPSTKKEVGKACKIGIVKTETWDIPRTDEGYQVILMQLIESIETLANRWSNKSPNTRTNYTSRSKDLRGLIRVFEKYRTIPNEDNKK